MGAGADPFGTACGIGTYDEDAHHGNHLPQNAKTPYHEAELCVNMKRVIKTGERLGERVLREQAQLRQPDAHGLLRYFELAGQIGNHGANGLRPFVPAKRPQDNILLTLKRLAD